MSNEGIFTVRTDSETLKALDELAQQQDRSRNYIVNEALENYLAYDRWFRNEVQQGLAEAKQGDFATEEEIARVFSKYKNADK